METDIPWTESGGWPRHVEDAARLLAGSEGSDGMYQRVGERPVSRESWSAFVTFAPYAYGCLVRTRDGDLVASVDDEGTSMWVRLTADQRDQLERTVGAARIVPRADWNTRRKRLLVQPSAQVSQTVISRVRIAQDGLDDRVSRLGAAA